MLKDLWKVLTGELSYRLVIAQQKALTQTVNEKNEAVIGRQRLADSIVVLAQRIDPLLLGVGRLIAKIEPMYGKDSDDPERKAESDRLGQEVIKKLMGEAAMQRRQRDVGV